MSSYSFNDFSVLDVISTKGKYNNVRILKAKLNSGKIQNSDTVCLKTFTSQKYSLVQEALREAKLLLSASMCHESIVKMYDCFTEQIQGSFCFGIVMEHFELGDLEDEIKRRKRANHRWREKDLWEIFRCLIEALESLQSRKICHRDIKPQNIFMDDQNVYKIGDFGVSKSEIMDSSSHKTLVGTPIYFSPLCAKAFLNYEIFGNSTVKHDMYKSDVFSLGLTFLRMATLQSIRGINASPQDAVNARINTLSYSNSLQKLLWHMLQINEDSRPDFVGLSRIMFDIKSDFVPSHLVLKLEEEVSVPQPTLIDTEMNDLSDCCCSQKEPAVDSDAETVTSFQEVCVYEDTEEDLPKMCRNDCREDEEISVEDSEWQVGHVQHAKIIRSSSRVPMLQLTLSLSLHNDSGTSLLGKPVEKEPLSSRNAKPKQ
jgi:serine/threonine protein kinase